MVKRTISLVSWTRCFIFLVALLAPLATGTASDDLQNIYSRDVEVQMNYKTPNRQALFDMTKLSIVN